VNVRLVSTSLQAADVESEASGLEVLTDGWALSHVIPAGQDEVTRSMLMVAPAQLEAW
jgi:hypothetical protein